METSCVDNMLLRTGAEMLSHNDDSSKLFSPLALSIAFGTLNLGSRGDTELQIRQKWFQCIAMDILSEYFEYKLRILNEEKSLCWATRLYVDKRASISPWCKQQINSVFLTEIEKLDFSDIERVRHQVNNFVAFKTGKKILELYDEDSVSAWTKIMLATSLYFKGNFKMRFQDARKSTFYGYKAEREVDLMHLDDVKVPYFETKEYQYVEIPMENNDYALFVILPIENSLFTIIDEIAAGQIRWLNMKTKMKPCVCKIAIPKFEASSHFSLRTTLRNMGIKSIFYNADFKAMGEFEDPARLDTVMHKCVFTVNEVGIEADPDAEVELPPEPMSSDDFKIVTANRPFLYGVCFRNTPFLVGQFL